jgi:hypothetical protein
MKKIVAKKRNDTLLVRHPTPKSGEGIRGYASRVDYENTIALFGPRLGNLKTACASLRDLESATGKQLDILCEGIFLKEVDPIDVTCEYDLKYPFPASWVCAKLKRICPCCLTEKGFMQGIWEIQVIDSCLVHGCHLIDRCRICRRSLFWTEGSLMACRCGAPLCDARTVPVGPLRESLDKLLIDRLFSDRVDPFAPRTQQMLPLEIDQSFTAIAVISFHIAARIDYAVNLRNASDKIEQQADFALRLINLGRPGIEAALFSALGNELQSLNPRHRPWLLCQDTEMREIFLWEIFALDWSSHATQFIRHVLLPAWDKAHRKWQMTVDPSLIEYVNLCDPAKNPIRALNERKKHFKKFGILGDMRIRRLIVRLGKRLKKLESRNENR